MCKGNCLKISLFMVYRYPLVTQHCHRLFKVYIAFCLFIQLSGRKPRGNWFLPIRPHWFLSTSHRHLRGFIQPLTGRGLIPQHCIGIYTDSFSLSVLVDPNSTSEIRQDWATENNVPGCIGTSGISFRLSALSV